MRQLVVASEYGEPADHIAHINKKLFYMRTIEKRDLALLVVSKLILNCRPFLRTAKVLNIPAMIHCTVTGLGGTKYEPHVPPYNITMDNLKELIDRLEIKPETVTIRIDPIIPELHTTQVMAVPYILESAASMGIKDCRVSVVDYYPHVRARMDKLGLKHPNRFQSNAETAEIIIDSIAYLAIQLDMKLHLCAEKLPSKPEINIDTEGCASKAAWERLGYTDLHPAARRQRNACTCDLNKIDLLRGLSKGCPNGCFYCYWKRKGEY